MPSYYKLKADTRTLYFCINEANSEGETPLLLQSNEKNTDWNSYEMTAANGAEGCKYEIKYTNSNRLKSHYVLQEDTPGGQNLFLINVSSGVSMRLEKISEDELPVSLPTLSLRPKTNTGSEPTIEEEEEERSSPCCSQPPAWLNMRTLGIFMTVLGCAAVAAAIITLSAAAGIVGAGLIVAGFCFFAIDKYRRNREASDYVNLSDNQASQ